MIKTRSLFLVPILSSPLLFIPFFGIMFYLIVVYFWYNKNKELIHLWIKDKKYKKNEYDDLSDLR